MASVGGSKALALLLVGMMTAAGLIAIGGARAQPVAPSVPLAASIAIPAPADAAPDPPAASPSSNASPLAKIAPALQDAARNPARGAYVDVMIHTTNVPALGRALELAGAQYESARDGKSGVEKFVARPWGVIGAPESIHVRVPESALVGLAGRPDVQYLDTTSPATLLDVPSSVFSEDQAAFDAYKARIAAGEKIPGPLGRGAPDVSPTSWAIAREHKAYDAWNLGFEGQGVNVAVIDTGEDFGNPSLANRWAVDTIVGSPWEGWPIMFHPASMEALMSPQFWTKNSDVDRTALPFWEQTLDDNTWYTNMDYVANDTNADGLLEYRDGTTNPLSGLLQRTPFENPQRYGNFKPATYNLPIGRSYHVGCAVAPGPCILSQSGMYHLGVARDDQLTAIWGEKVGILLVDSTTPYVYDTAYVDLNFDQNFTNDKPLTRADPLAVADLTGDGVSDISGGLLYFIASSTRVTRDVILPITTGTETNATLANRWAAVNVTGYRTWLTPARLFLNDGATDTYLSGATEDIRESITLSGAATQGGRWAFGGNPTFGIASRTSPANVITGQPVSSRKLLQGPGTDFSVGLVYELRDNSGPLQEFVDYSIDLTKGEITFANNYPAGDVITATYQLATYTLEPVSGRLSFLAPLPVGWSLWATYEKGVPIPYSQEYGPAHGYDTFIPANGQLVAFHGDFDRQTHGSFVTSTIAAHPFGNLASPLYEIFGTAPQARVIGIAACCNVAGSLGIFASIEDQRTFAAVGYDGVPGTGDEAVILSNSFGDPDLRNTGFTFEDRWLIDFSTRYPNLTTLIALGNNGPGYGTSAPGGSSPGVIGVGAGTSQDYRIEYGNDLGGGYYVFPDCPPPPIDPKDCTDLGGSVGGPGPYGDDIYFSSRGPTLMGTPKPDIVSIGGYAVEAAPLNALSTNPANLNGNFAFGVFSGTSQATPVTAGVSALIAQAYRLAHGTMPGNVQLRALLKSGADDMHKDILQQGAGWTNALRSVQSALDGFPGSGGVTSDTDYWVPGAYSGIHRVGFVNFLPAGQSDATPIRLTNHDLVQPKTVTVKPQVYQLAAPAFRYAFSLATGAEQFLVLKPTGIYDDRGFANVGGPGIDFRPYWSTSDFVKATLAYNASAYTGSTSLRLDTFDWYDSNFNGLFDQDGGCVGGVPQHGCQERNRMTVDAPGGGANSVWDAIHSPGARIHSGWALNVRSGAAAAIPATLIIEFYERVDWTWLTTGIPPPGTLALAANGGTASFTVTARIPGGTPAGLYEGAIYVDDAGNITTIPIAITVPVPDFPLVLGGNVPATSLYDNSAVVQGARSNGPWQQIADNRFVWGDFSPIASRPGRHIIYNALMEGPNSDPEWFVYQLAADAAWPDAARFGPGTMNPISQTGNVPGVTATAYPNREFRSTVPGVDTIGGVVAFQVKAWNAWAEEEAFAANIGIMQVFPNNVSVVTNKVVGTTFVSVWSNVPLYDGLAATKTNTSGQTLTNQFVNQDGANNPYTASYTRSFTLAKTASFVVDVTGLAGNNIDLYIMRDTGPPGVFDAGDPIVCASTTAGSREHCEVPQAPDGDYWVAVHGRTVPAGTTRFTLTYSLTVGVNDPNFSCLACPTTTIAPYTFSGVNIEWRFPGDQPEGPVIGFLYLSPRYVVYGIVQLLSIQWVFDISPVQIDPSRDLKPDPNSATRDATVPVSVGMVDLANNPGQIERFSIRLLVDGRDVTHQSSVVVGFDPGDSAAMPPIPPGYIRGTVTWQHPDQPFPDGRHSAVVSARDFAGNEVSEVWSWTVDATAPALTIANPGPSAITNQAHYPFVAWTDPGSTVTVAVNGVAANASVNPEGRITATLDLVEGTSQIVATSADPLGNTATATRMITVDTTSPIIFAAADVYTPTNHVLTTISGTVSERVTAVWLNGVPMAVGADGSFSVVVPLVEGPNAFVLTTVDAAGNLAAKTLAPITRDTVAPTILLNALPALIAEINTTTVDVSGSVPDADIFFVSINGRTVRVDQGQFRATFDLAVGDNTFIVRAEDETGNAAQAVASVAYAPVIYHDLPNYNSLIASGVAVVLLIVGFVVGYLLSGRAEKPEEEATPESPSTKEAMPPEPEGASEEPEASGEEEEL